MFEVICLLKASEAQPGLQHNPLEQTLLPSSSGPVVVILDLICFKPFKSPFSVKGEILRLIVFTHSSGCTVR